MKINKLILKISHLFGCRKNEAHIDDVKIYIPTIYVLVLYKPLVEYQINDVKEQSYKQLDANEKLKKNCTRVKQLWVVLEGGEMKCLNYIDNVLYWPGLDDIAAKRADRLNKILNEK